MVLVVTMHPERAKHNAAIVKRYIDFFMAYSESSVPAVFQVFANNFAS
ncbi:hypothetical protein XSR1_120084 [Xenorhabdus szentirmaii DSM 16338]|uniref:Uncharacterized protein n=1 Tax=Xenorhabdus szentirmaii DSM 16338 TaxID=1427518 RepID=W1IU48_9GAMM|nr:hypothetical protein XSR1_120084 [Xenorhabdus szentirmaii DSM 16338]